MMLNFVLSPASALTPLVVTDVFGEGAVEMGWTRAVFGAGTLLGGIVLSAWGGFKRRIVTCLGVQIWYVLGGAICIVGAVAASFVPSLMNIEMGRSQS